MFVLSFALFWAVGGMPEPAKAQPRPQIAKCVPGQARTADEYCLVDGDTIWIDGEKLRMEGYDTRNRKPTSVVATPKSRWHTEPVIG